VTCWNPLSKYNNFRYFFPSKSGTFGAILALLCVCVCVKNFKLVTSLRMHTKPCCMFSHQCANQKTKESTCTHTNKHTFAYLGFYGIIVGPKWPNTLTKCTNLSWTHFGFQWMNLIQSPSIQTGAFVLVLLHSGHAVISSL